MVCSLDLAARHEMPRDKRQTASLHAAQLKVALRLYQAKNGTLPATLDELVQQKYLPALPRDPFDRNNLPLRYRRSREKGRWSAVVWSVGEDGRDDDGRIQGAVNPHTALGEDLIYRVPPPPR